MICSQCGNDVAEGSAVCPRCGAPQGTRQGADVRLGAPGGPASAGGPTASAATVTPAFNFDLKRLTRNDQIVGAATIVFFISLFLPWFTSSAGIYSASVNGLWHGYMYIGFILALAVIAYLVLCAGFQALPFRLPLDHEKALLAATGVIFVLTVISFVFKPSGAGVVSIGWGFGAFVGLAAAVAAVAPLGLPFLRSRAGR
jgi:hypothetical protein